MMKKLKLNSKTGMLLFLTFHLSDWMLQNIVVL